MLTERDRMIPQAVESRKGGWNTSMLLASILVAANVLGEVYYLTDSYCLPCNTNQLSGQPKKSQHIIPGSMQS